MINKYSDYSEVKKAFQSIFREYKKNFTIQHFELRINVEELDPKIKEVINKMGIRQLDDLNDRLKEAGCDIENGNFDYLICKYIFNMNIEKDDPLLEDLYFISFYDNVDLWDAMKYCNTLYNQIPAGLKEIIYNEGLYIDISNITYEYIKFIKNTDDTFKFNEAIWLYLVIYVTNANTLYDNIVVKIRKEFDLDYLNVIDIEVLDIDFDFEEGK